MPATWPQAFEAIAAKVKAAKPDRIGAIAGDLAAVEEMYALKDLMTRLGSKNLDAGQDGAALNPEWGRATVSVQRHHRRHRARRRAADRRLEPAPRGGRAQRAHPQALARRQIPRSR